MPSHEPPSPTQLHPDDGRRALQKVIDEELGNADKYAYERAQNALAAAKKWTTMAGLRTARDEAHKYCAESERQISGTSFQRQPVMLVEASEALTWLEQALKGRPYEVTLESLDIPAGHAAFKEQNSYDYTIALSGAFAYDASELRTPPQDSVFGFDPPEGPSRPWTMTLSVAD
jgi:hypothetical protein